MKTEQEIQEFADDAMNSFIGRHKHEDYRRGIIAGAKWMQEQGNWISVEEERPPSIEYVNVWDGKYVCTRCFSKTHDFLNTANFIETTKVTHWQPLPTPPKP